MNNYTIFANQIVLVDRFLLKIGAIRESNPGPLAPETRIIPLDQSPKLIVSFYHFLRIDI